MGQSMGMGDPMGMQMAMGDMQQGGIEMLIPGNKVGLIIGKGGETIKQLQVSLCWKSVFTFYVSR